MSYVVRRVFQTDDGPIARWWMGPWLEAGQGWGEPEDSQVFSSPDAAEQSFFISERIRRGDKPVELFEVQSLADAMAEVGASVAP